MGSTRADLLVLVLCMCAASACRPDAGTDFVWDGAVVTANGARTTTNGATPALPPGAVTTTTLWTAPTFDIIDWAEPSRVVEGAGSYYVVDRRSTRIHIVGSDGHVVRSFGKQGPGPGEIMVAGDVGFVGDHVVVRDMGKHTIEVYTPDGTFVKSIPLGRVGFGFATLEPDGVIAARLAGNGQSWIRVGLDGTTAPLSVPASASPTARACTRVATFGDRVAQLDCAVPVLTVSASSGEIQQVIVVGRDSLFATDAQLQIVREKLQRDMAAENLPASLARELLESTMENARVIKPWRAARQDRATGMIAIWEQMPMDLGGGDARVHLLSKDGVYLDAIAFDDQWVDFTINDSRIAALAVNDSTGIPQLVVHRIMVPAGVFESAAAAVAGTRR